jgi:hypothetical protein
MEICIMGKFPWIFGTMPCGWGRQVKIAPTFSGHGGQVAWLAEPRVKCSNLAEYFEKFGC